MPIQAFIDESGGKGQGPVFVFAGWIGEAADWVALTSDWKHCLSTHPSIDYFKMREAARLTEQFLRFTEADRDKKLRELAKIIQRHRLRAYYCVTDLQAFAETIARAYLRPFRDPYFWAFHQTILGICLDLSRRGHREPAEITFDEHVIFGPRTKDWYPLIRESMADNGARSVLPAEPIFGNDLESLPLQAADMLAWLLHRSLAGRGANPFLWLAEEFTSVEFSTYCQAVDRARLNTIIEQAYRSLLGGERQEFPTD